MYLDISGCKMEKCICVGPKIYNIVVFYHPPAVRFIFIATWRVLEHFYLFVPQKWYHFTYKKKYSVDKPDWTDVLSDELVQAGNAWPTSALDAIQLKRTLSGMQRIVTQKKIPFCESKKCLFCGGTAID